MMNRIEAAKHFNLYPWELEVIEGVNGDDRICEYWIPKSQMCGGPCVFRRDITDKKHKEHMKLVKSIEDKQKRKTAFLDHLENCSKIVASWPKWKRDLL